MVETKGNKKSTYEFFHKEEIIVENFKKMKSDIFFRFGDSFLESDFVFVVVSICDI